MITNFETNKVFIPNGLIREDVTGCLIYFIHRHEIDWGILPGSSSPLHIWARDYMPVQVSKDKYVRFCYTPDYLQVVLNTSLTHQPFFQNLAYKSSTLTSSLMAATSLVVAIRWL